MSNRLTSLWIHARGALFFMLRSMTAYGKSCLSTPTGTFSVEIHSVNRRHLDLHCHLPTGCACFESKIRNLISNVIQRGNVQYRLRIVPSEESCAQIQVNRPLLKALKQEWQEIASVLGYSPSVPLPVELIAERPDLFLQNDISINDADLWESIQQVTSAALEQLISDKEREGQILAQAITSIHGHLVDLLAQLQGLLPQAIANYKQRLHEKLHAELPESLLQDERLLREVCIFAEKADVAEEVARFQAHLDQLAHLLIPGNGGAGKPLEFLLQEMVREINTLGAKSSDINVIQLTLLMKGEIEKIREQVQNIE
jgi:uncharacterized protein (TIGR00255 family)